MQPTHEIRHHVHVRAGHQTKPNALSVERLL
jgi:hypothetical protein